MDIQPGIYKHFRGKRYEVIGVARHSETLEELVVYRALYDSAYGHHALWVRPKSMFLETMEHEGQKIPRFTRVGDITKHNMS